MTANHHYRSLCSSKQTNFIFRKDPNRHKGWRNLTNEKQQMNGNEKCNGCGKVLPNPLCFKKHCEHSASAEGCT